jgi:thioredoxin-related protein
MSSKHKKKHKKAPLKKKTFNWKKLTNRSLITFSFIAVISIPLYFFSNQSKIEHDLSVVGNGRIATVVQIHDPNCQLCNQLKRNVASVQKEFRDKIQFRIANIKTVKGKRFADKYNVPHVTLLFFDKKGNRTNTMQGVSSSKDIHQSLTALSRLR